MNPPSPMFLKYGLTLLARLRLTQLLNLARAWELNVDLNGTKEDVLPLLVAAEKRGIFNQAPKRPYYFECAKWNTDQIKKAKVDGLGIGPLMRWTGPDPDPKPEYEPRAAVKAANRKRNERNIISVLRKEAKELGINSFSKGRDELARMIAEKKGMMAPANVVE